MRKKLWAFVVPASTDAQTLSAFNKKDIKARRIILDAVKDHVIPHISRKTRAIQMWDALTSLFQSSNENRKMVLREKLKSIKMAKAEGVISYLTRISQVRDELAIVGEVVSISELPWIALNGVAKPWVVFVEAIVARENCLLGIGFGLILFRRRSEEVLCKAALLLAGKMRRIWH